MAHSMPIAHQSHFALRAIITATSHSDQLTQAGAMNGCRVCRQLQAYVHLQTLHDADSRNPTANRLPDPVHSGSFISTPADLYCFVKTFMFGYTGMSSYCAPHRNESRFHCFVVMFHQDPNCEVTKPSPSIAESLGGNSGAHAATRRVAAYNAAVNRRVLTEVLRTTARLNIDHSVDYDGSRATGPLLHTGSHCTVTQYWLTEILKYLTDACCFSHWYDTIGQSPPRHESIAPRRSYLTDRPVDIAAAASGSSLGVNYPILLGLLEADGNVRQ